MAQELRRIVHLKGVTNDKKNSKIAATRAGKKLNQLTYILNGISNVINKRAEIDDSETLQEWIDFRSLCCDNLGELYQLQAREAESQPVYELANVVVKNTAHEDASQHCSFPKNSVSSRSSITSEFWVTFGL